ncbi:unnamed protein product [Ostreobium quekettii]|uniref:Uncharacterized protein n=1 Tax=Ostreobium quekettii TaxID=121088 RepID=A0A8S1JCM6_9CHLO|nr:unnamed protein product [Ostreobium quekettii]|eukprot:evm.model.scf_52.15 EVM.evm.TU.scf_52.15   scf_52:140714-142889(+)
MESPLPRRPAQPDLLAKARTVCLRPLRSLLRRRGSRRSATDSINFGGRGGGSGGGEQRGGGGGGSGDDGDDGVPQEKIMWKGWYNRAQGDAWFSTKVSIEQMIGLSAAVLGDMAARDNWGLNELDFVFSTLVVGSILNFSLMYLLASIPATGSGVPKLNMLQKLFSDQILKSWGAPGAHIFEKGYSLPLRATHMVYKGVLFALVGFCAGVVGTTVSNWLLLTRQRLDPQFELQNRPLDVLHNSLTWACHMGASANVRYQVLFGLDMVLCPAMPAQAFLTYSAVVRTLNNILGGASFVFFAKLFGVQETGQEVVSQKS